MAAPRVAVVVGSLRKGSNSRRLAEGAIAAAGDRLDAALVETDLPLYNEDLETAAPPPAWTAFRDALREATGVLFVTPEYNRSLSGAMKNAIDVGSRPYGQSVWAGKRAAVISSSPGMTGGFGANHALRQTFTFLDIHAMQSPEAYWGKVGDMLADDGLSETGMKRMKAFVDAFVDWVGA